MKGCHSERVVNHTSAMTNYQAEIVQGIDWANGDFQDRFNELIKTLKTQSLNSMIAKGYIEQGDDGEYQPTEKFVSGLFS